MKRNLLMASLAILGLVMSACGTGISAAKPGDAFSSLEKTVSHRHDSNYRAVYSFSAKDPVSNEPIEYKTTYYRQGDWQRIDVLSTTATGDNRETRAYFNRKNADMTVCFKDGQAGDWSCDHLTAQTAIAAADASLFYLFDPSEGFAKQLVQDSEGTSKSLTVDGSRNVAGQTGQSYVYQGSVETGGEAEFVITDDGLLLSMVVQTADGQGDSKIEALEVNRQVSAADFAPPASSTHYSGVTQ